MDGVYLLEEVSDLYWSSPENIPIFTPNMSRRSSEWDFQGYLEEIWKSEQGDDQETGDVVAIEKPNHPHHFPADLTSMTQFGVDDCEALLKRRLDVACAAARTRESSVVSLESASLPDYQSQNLMCSQLASQVTGPWNAFPTQQVEFLDADCKPFSFPAIPDQQKIAGTQIMQANSGGSSRDQSDDDELDGETETTENMEPTNEKRVRRKQSNRESAKRSRKRKQEQLSELETQAARLRTEKSSLLKLLSEWDRKYSEAAVDNRVLKADIETLRAKVMMVESKVKRVTGSNAVLFQPISDMHSVDVSFGRNRTVINSNHLTHQQAPVTAHYRASSTGFPNNSTASN